MARPSSHLKDFRVDTSLFFMLGIHVLTMTVSVQLQYHEPMFTLLIGTVYGPVLALTILIVSVMEPVVVASIRSYTPLTRGSLSFMILRSTNSHKPQQKSTFASKKTHPIRTFTKSSFVLSQVLFHTFYKVYFGLVYTSSLSQETCKGLTWKSTWIV